MKNYCHFKFLESREFLAYFCNSLHEKSCSAQNALISGLNFKLSFQVRTGGLEDIRTSTLISQNCVDKEIAGCIGAFYYAYQDWNILPR